MDNLESQVPATIAILAVISFVGSIGNIFVILIYIKRCDKVTSNLFMTVLAASDTFTCLVIIPLTIFIEYHNWMTSNAFCKIYMFFNNCVIPFSALLISLIAIDRYFCICHPFLQVMNLNKSKIFILGVLLLSILLGIAASFQVHVIVSVGDNSSTPGNFTQCVEASYWKNQTFSEKLFFQITQKSQLVSYSICILIVICLYSNIYYTVLKVRRKKDKLKGIKIPVEKKTHKFTEIPTTYKKYACENIHFNQISQSLNKQPAIGNYKSHHLSIPQQDNMSPSSDGGYTASPSYSSLNSINAQQTYIPIETTTNFPNSNSTATNINQTNDKKNKSLRETKFIQNLKLAAMLFVVALTYIVTFLPANLMANKLINMYLPIFYLYYMNNATNPIIYCFMNRNFRNELKSLTFLRIFFRQLSLIK